MIISGNRRVPLVYGSSKKTPNYRYNYGLPSATRIGCNCFVKITPTPPPTTSATYLYNFTGNIPPGSAFATVIAPGNKLRINIIDIFNNNQTSFLTSLSSATTITFTSFNTPSNFINFTVSSYLSSPLYWEYNVTIGTFNGALVANEKIIITYS